MTRSRPPAYLAAAWIVGVVLGVWVRASCGADMPPVDDRPMTFWQVVVAGGLIELVIILCSIAATTLVVEHFITIRHSRLIPRDIVHAVRAHMREKEYNEILRLCEDRPCFFTRAVESGLRRLKHGFDAVQESIAETIEKEGTALHSKISYLSFLASVTPMLGLLGTVWGMIRAFNKIAYFSGLGRASLLAKGVSQALITTATGLVVAIPVMAFFFFFRDRVNKIILEVEAASSELFEDFRPVRKVADNTTADRD